jgi:hypothetical protein
MTWNAVVRICPFYPIVVHKFQGDYINFFFLNSSRDRYSVL